MNIQQMQQAIQWAVEAFERDKAAGTPGVSIQQGGQSSMQRSSAAIQVPGTHGIPQGLLDQLNMEGAYDFLNQNYSVPPEHLATQAGALGQQYQTGIAGAQAQANEGFNLGKMTTMEKVLGGVGVAGAGLAAFGGHPKAAGTMVGMGLGAVAGAPEAYRERQDRTLKNRLGELGATYNAGMAPLLAEQGQFTAEQDVLGKNIDQDRFMAGMGMELGGFGLRAAETERRRTGAGRAVNPLWEDYRRATDLMEGGAEFEDLPVGARTGYLALPRTLGADVMPAGVVAGGAGTVGIPEGGLSDADVRRGRLKAKERAKAAETKVYQLAKKQDVGLANQWWNGQLSDEELIAQAAQGGPLDIDTGIMGWGEGQGNTELITAIREYQRWTDPDQVQNWIDTEYSTEFPEAEQQERGRETTLKTLGIPDPPPNDGSMTPQEYEQFKQRWPEIYRSQR